MGSYASTEMVCANTEQQAMTDKDTTRRSKRRCSVQKLDILGASGEHRHGDTLHAMQRVFISIGITLDGYISIIDGYHVIQSGLLGQDWKHLVSNEKYRLPYYTSLSAMNQRIARYLSGLSAFYDVDMDFSQHYNLTMDCIQLHVDHEDTTFTCLVYIALYFSSMQIRQNNAYRTPSSRVWDFNITPSEVTKYWQALQKLDEYKLSGEDEDKATWTRTLDLQRTGNLNLDYLRIKLQYLCDEDFVQIYERTKKLHHPFKLYCDDANRGYVPFQFDAMQKKVIIDDEVSLHAMQSMVYPQFIDDEVAREDDCTADGARWKRYHLFNMESTISWPSAKVTTRRHQFLFESVKHVQGSNSTDIALNVWMTYGRVNNVLNQCKVVLQPPDYAVSKSVLLNHFL